MSSALSPPHTSKGTTRVWSVRNVLLTMAIPAVALVAWLGCARATPRLFEPFAGCKIGSRFNQAQVKAIDVLTGAVLAPLFMAILNHVWFGSVRESAVNEQQWKAIPLRTLVAASGTSTGSYDVFLLRDLMQGRTWRLCLLGMLTLLSAVSRSALSNIIAYEAFTEATLSKTPVTLRLQRNLALENSGLWSPSVVFDLDTFDGEQLAEAAKNLVSLLADLSLD